MAAVNSSDLVDYGSVNPTRLLPGLMDDIGDGFDLFENTRFTAER